MSVADVIQAIDGPFTVTACSEDKATASSTTSAASAIRSGRSGSGLPHARNRDDCEMAAEHDAAHAPWRTPRYTTMKLPIYMDYHATTPVDPRVLEAMLPYFTQKFGNAASRNHRSAGKPKRRWSRRASRLRISSGANSKEIIFTSGATESNNLAIKGVAEMYREKGQPRHHVRHRAQGGDRHLQEAREAGRARDVPASPERRPHRSRRAARAITDKTILITIMTANNEIGVCSRLPKSARSRRRRGSCFHTDAVQAAGKIPFDVNQVKPTWCQSARTRCTARRASAPCMCAAGTLACCSPSRSMVVVTSAACARAR
jgi:hypothetical protein